MRARSALVLLLLLGLVISACGGGTDDADSGAAAVGASAGLTVLGDAADVEDPEGASVPADEVETVAVGETVITDVTGLVELEYVDGSLSRLGPETRFTVVELAGDDTAPQIDTELDVGRTWHRVAETARSDDRFTVTTNVAVAAVRGTVFSVICLDEGACSFAVFEGEVAILIDGELVALLTAGQSLTVGPDGPGDVVELTENDLDDNDWYRENLERDDLDGEAIVAGGDDDGAEAAEGGGGPITPREPLSVTYNYRDSSSQFDEVIVTWDQDRVAMYVPGTFQWIDAGETQIMCDLEGGQCFEFADGATFPGTGQSMANPLLAFTGEIPLFDLTSTRQIAGRPASCGSFTDPETGDSGQVCVDDETGAILFADGGDTRYEAISVSGPVSEYLEPAAPVQQMPTS